MVLDVLDPAVGKVDRVLAINNTGTIIVLSLVEGSSGVVIGNSVGVGVGGNLSEVISSISGMGHRGVEGVSDDGSVDGVSNSVVGKSTVDETVTGVVGERGVDGVNTVGNNSISSVKSVGGISHDGGVGSEGLALGGGPV